MKQIITVTGPSGSGKTSIVNAVQIFYNYIMKGLPIPDTVPEVQKQALAEVSTVGIKPVGKTPICGEAVSHTTRQRRVGEIEDVTYHYVTEEVIQGIEKLEETFYAGTHYCLSKTAIDETNAEIVLAIVDQNGARSIKKNAPDTIKLFLEMYPKQMRGRLEFRNDSEKDIISRINNADKYNEYVFEDADIRIDSTGSLGSALGDFIQLIETLRK